MANELYSLGKQALLEGDINWLTDDISVSLVDSAVYTPNIVTDQFYNIIPSVVAGPVSLGSKTSTLGVADAADSVFPSVTGAISEYVVIFKNTGVPATSQLIALIDTATGLPVTPDGNNINILWDDGANKIFAI